MNFLKTAFFLIVSTSIFAQHTGFTNAASFGFLPEASGTQNTHVLQKALDQGGTIVVSKPGTYKLAGTVYVGSHTTVDFGNGVFVQKVNEQGEFSHVLRVQMQPDGKKFISQTPPSHESGSKEYDGIVWGKVQDDVTYTAGVRNVVFRDIFLEKPRIGFSVHFDNDRYSRSYYPGAEVPKQEHLLFDNVRVLHDKLVDFLSVNTPMDVVNIRNCVFKTGGINFHGNKAMTDYLKTKINMIGCVFNQNGEITLLKNSVDGKEIELKTAASVVYFDNFSAKIMTGNGKVKVESDLKK